MLKDMLSTRLKNIKDINIYNYSFTRELYITLNRNKSPLISKFDKIIMLQRSLFNLNYGTLEQVGFYLNTVLTFDSIVLTVEDKDSLLELLVLKTLSINVSYTLNIKPWLDSVIENNKTVVNEIKHLLKITSENVSHFNIIHLMETMERLYLPDRINILESIVKNLVEYYNRQISTSFNPDYYFYMIGDFDTLGNYLTNNFECMVSSTYTLDNLDFIKDPIFTRISFISGFIDTLNTKLNDEIEDLIVSTESNVMFKYISKLSDIVISTHDIKLIHEFQAFVKKLTHLDNHF